MASDKNVKVFEVEVDSVGPINVYVQGNLDKMRDGVVFLTVHDVGSSYRSWINFTNDEDMELIRERSLFLHVSLPGQEPDSSELDSKFTFPDLEQLSVNLVTVLDTLRVKQVVGLGEGAGASILTRFGMHYPNRLHGVVAINSCAATTSGYKEIVKEKMKTVGKIDVDLNEKNVGKYMTSYMNRGEILSQLKEKIKFDFLLITGGNYKHAGDTEKIHRQMTPGMCSMLKVEKVSSPLLEAPDKVAEALLLFCQGQGLMPTVNRRISRSDSSGSGGGRRPSMSDLDIPNIQRLLVV